MLKDPGNRFLLIFCLCCSTLLITGCQGCRDDSQKTAEEKRKEEEERKEAEKPSFQSEEAVFYPGQYDEVIRNNRTKRGHWVSADYRITANKFDVQGELLATSSTTTAPVQVEFTDYFPVSKRPFSIPKGEQKILSTSVFLPRRDKGVSENVSFILNRNSGGLAMLNELHGVRLMKSFQYHMVVLTKRPDAYTYLNVIDSVVLPESEIGLKAPRFYMVVRTDPANEPIALPRYSLNWTTISYLIWDDLDVDQLDEDQQQALIDWLHFGGQLILSGPDCLDKMAGTFLEPYLPAKFAGTKNLTEEDFSEVNQNWAIKDKNQDIRRVINVDDKSPILGVKFDLHPDATTVTGTGQIVVERQIGRGRIVATAFSMDDKPILRWPSFRSFFNGALLRRPPREFGPTALGSLVHTWTTDQTTIFDPLVGTGLRYLSRDLSDSVGTEKRGTPIDAEVLTEEISGFIASARPTYSFKETKDDRFRAAHASNSEERNLQDHRRYGGFVHDSQSGTAGWNDLSGVSNAARETLKNSAGITPPDSDFVLQMLALYLLVLVPVNWAIFRMIGRVEWAWIAAPLIAIAGAFTVARMASLDIGFVRSNTQVGCLEIFADYPRAHVAQYSALYTSLSTGYDLELDNPSAQSLPFGDPSRKWREKTPSPVTLRRTLNRRMEGFQVQSNSTGMLHTELMYDLGGVISFKQSDSSIEVLNATEIDLEQAAVIRRTDEGVLQGAWIGDLLSNSQTDLTEFESIESAYQPWESTLYLKPDLVESYWAKLSEEAKLDENGETYRRLGDAKEILPELAKEWDLFLQTAARNVNESGDALLEASLTYPLFTKIMKQMVREDRLSVRQIFQAVTENLAVAPGESRLLAVSDQSIGNNRFEPASTQTQQQTLVVVHLQRPALEAAAPDVNAVEDFTGGRSNLDWFSDDEDWDQEGAGESEEETEDDGSKTETADDSEN